MAMNQEIKKVKKPTSVVIKSGVSHIGFTKKTTNRVAGINLAQKNANIFMGRVFVLIARVLLPLSFSSLREEMRWEAMYAYNSTK